MLLIVKDELIQIGEALRFGTVMIQEAGFRQDSLAKRGRAQGGGQLTPAGELPGDGAEGTAVAGEDIAAFRAHLEENPRTLRAFVKSGAAEVINGITQEPAAKEKSAALYAKFIVWYHDNIGQNEPTGTWFGKQLRQKFEKSKSNGCVIYHGIALNSSQGEIRDYTR